jgi:hypoxanthine-DNA glycosylase
MPEYTHVTHGFPPLFDAESRTLILGSMPSPKSREQAFYYGHPQNRFWRVLAAVFGAPEPESIEEKRAIALANGIALWDSLVECDIRGARDTSIRNPVASDIPWMLAQTKITRVFTTGAAADKYYRLYNLHRTGIESVRLPSTSPANCAVSFERLVESYTVLKE